MPSVLNYTTTRRSAVVMGGQIGGVKSPEPGGAGFGGGQKPTGAGAVNYSGGSLSHSASFGSSGDKTRHPDVRAPNKQLRAMADMAINGDYNENEPDMVEPSPDRLKAAMANRDTAVAVMHPSLQGVTRGIGMPVGTYLFCGGGEIKN